MKRFIFLTVVAFALVALPAFAKGALRADPWVFDPNNTDVSESAWVTHEGLKDAGRSDHALYLTKDAPTSTLAAAGAEITFEGTLTELGFDYRNDGHCGAGAPRFNVHTEDGTYFFGCAHGIQTPSAEDPDWTRVRFTDADAFPATATTPAWPGFGNVEVTGIDIVFDEGTDVGEGFVYLDNIDINGTLIGKPGNAK